MIEQLVPLVLAAAVGAIALALGLRSRGAGKARRAAQGGYFDLCLPLLGKVTKGDTPHGFARIAARYRGFPVDLQALPDLLSYRKLPTLWLMVTIPAAMPVTATTSIMRRPTGSEVFSRFGQLPVEIETPAGFPADSAVRTDDPGGLPDESILADQRAFLADDRIKELVISPKGLRIVWLAEEADRTRYLLYRDAEMGRTALAPEVLGPILDRLTRLAGMLDRSADKAVSA